MFTSFVLVSSILFWTSILTTIFSATGRIPIFIPIVAVIATIAYTVCFVRKITKDPKNELTEAEKEIEKKLIEYLRDKDAF